MPLTLDVLSDDEAHEMLGRRLGQDRIAAEPAAAAELISLVRPAPAGAGRRRRPRRNPAGALAGRPGRRAAGHQEPAGGARGRRRGHRRAGRAVLVLRPAPRARGPDVPAARRAPRPGHLAVGGGQPGRGHPLRRGRRAARADPDPRGGRAPAGPVHVPRPAPRLRRRPGRTARPRARAPGRRAPGARPLPAHRDGGLEPVQPVPVRAAAGQPAAGRAARRGGGQGPGDGLVRRREPGAARADRLRRRERFRHPRLADPLDARPVLQPARPVAGLHRHPADRAGRGQRLGDTLALAHAHHLLGHVLSRPAPTRRPTRTSAGRSTTSASSATAPTRPSCSTASPACSRSRNTTPRRWPSRWTRCGWSRPSGTGGPWPPWRTASAGCTPTWASTTRR